jgi:hypothetical protein
MADASSASLLGAGPLELLAYIAGRFDAIEVFTLFEYDGVPIIQKRLALNQAEVQIVEDALKLREEFAMPFWDATMLSCFSTGKLLPNLLQAAVYHQSPARLRSIPREQIQLGLLEKLRTEVSINCGLAVCSEVQCRGGVRAHIPLLDFHCPKRAENLILVVQVAEMLLPGGFAVLESGKSFHVYGLKLHSQRDFDGVLIKALLFSPIIDRAYIAHQLLEHRAGLRITRGVSDKPDPIIVHVNTGEAEAASV